MNDPVPAPEPVPETLVDVFLHRCEGATWCPDGTCSHCGGARPSLALEAIRAGAEIHPTDKPYKLYIQGGGKPVPSPGGKCYTNHFSQSQALEFIRLAESGDAKVAHPGYFYSGLAWGHYLPAIEVLLPTLPRRVLTERREQAAADAKTAREARFKAAGDNLVGWQFTGTWPEVNLQLPFGPDGDANESLPKAGRHMQKIVMPGAALRLYQELRAIIPGEFRGE